MTSVNEVINKEHLHEIITSNLPIGFFVVNRDGEFVDFNSAAERITGFCKAEVLGKSHFQILHGSQDSQSCSLMKRTLKKQDGTIRVEFFEQAHHILVHVKDTGVGIAKDNIPYIFDAFFRESSDSNGSGLGLAISKKIIEAHDGRVSVESSLGKGSTLAFFFQSCMKDNEMEISNELLVFLLIVVGQALCGFRILLIPHPC